jgi:steroid 5-alpha reductase family enzyme
MIDEPLGIALIACGVIAFGCWLVSVVTRNYSQVDRVWSFALPAYVVWFAGRARFADARLDLMAVLAIAWGARLTYNFARKGGYRRGGEDYRWPALHKKIGEFRFQLLNATFIAPVQNAILLGLALPAWVALRHAGTPLNWIDGLAVGGFALFFTGEVIADQQQWRFQTDKHARKARGERVEAEFLTTGLFAYSRHPNFFCEQAMWWTFYVFAVAASAQWWNVSVVGAAALTALFQGSTAFTEQLTLAKYPAYAAYQKRVSRLLPLPSRGK